IPVSASRILAPRAWHRAADGSGGIKAVTKTGEIGTPISGGGKCRGTGTGRANSDSWLLPTSKTPCTSAARARRARAEAQGQGGARGGGRDADAEDRHALHKEDVVVVEGEEDQDVGGQLTKVPRRGPVQPPQLRPEWLIPVHHPGEVRCVRHSHPAHNLGHRR